MLYEGKDGWDGKYNGKYVMASTYFYILTLEDGLNTEVTATVKGTVTVVR
ncbi:MAG: hypothetical protein HC896_14715 [Bacteroidales bacterium]|nr:hypothetical protein [Bacteroidales bacterium]